MSVDRETLDVYENRLEDYIRASQYALQEKMRSDFAARLPKGGYVLDLGSGPGLDSEALMKAGLKLRALDATLAFVQEARRRGVDAHLGTFDDLTEQDAYDGIWASFSLLHAKRTAFPGHLDQIKSALKPGGTLFLGMKTGTGEGRDALGRFYTYYTKEALEDALRSRGFTIADSQTRKGKGLAGTDDGFVLILADG